MSGTTKEDGRAALARLEAAIDTQDACISALAIARLALSDASAAEAEKARLADEARVAVSEALRDLKDVLDKESDADPTT